MSSLCDLQNRVLQSDAAGRNRLSLHRSVPRHSRPKPDLGQLRQPNSEDDWSPGRKRAMSQAPPNSPRRNASKDVILPRHVRLLPEFGVFAPFP